MPNTSKGAEPARPKKKPSPRPSRRRPTSAGPAPTPPSRSAPPSEEVAVRAYFLFLERGGEGGRDLDDWLLAERELSD